MLVRFLPFLHAFLLLCQYVAASSSSRQLHSDIQDVEEMDKEMTELGQQHMYDDHHLLLPEVSPDGVDFVASAYPDDDASAIDMDGQRVLWQMPPCPGGGGPISAFTLDIKLIPQGGGSIRTNARRP